MNCLIRLASPSCAPYFIIIYDAEGFVCPGQALLLIFVSLYRELTSCLAEITSQRCLVLFAVRSLSKIHSLVAWASLSESECKGTHFCRTGKTSRELFWG